MVERNGILVVGGVDGVGVLWLLVLGKGAVWWGFVVAVWRLWFGYLIGKNT